MRAKRLVPQGEDAVFHLISRTAYQALNIGQKEKRVFRAILAKQAEFCGVEILAFCLLDNHFHLLVRIPFQPKITDEEIVRRYTALYCDHPANEQQGYRLTPAQLEKMLKAGDSRAQSMRKRLIARMGNVSVFMKELKQRFGIWYNREHQNHGTLWATRFDSILVENVAKVLQWVSAYIELNPVRLRLCESPDLYPHSSFGQASQGNVQSQQWICNRFSCKHWSTAQKHYQKMLINHQTQIEKDAASIKGLKTGVIGQKTFFEKYHQIHQQKLKRKSHLPVTILKNTLLGVVCVGLGFLMIADYPRKIGANPLAYT